MSHISLTDGGTINPVTRHIRSSSEQEWARRIFWLPLTRFFTIPQLNDLMRFTWAHLLRALQSKASISPDFIWSTTNHFRDLSICLRITSGLDAFLPSPRFTKLFFRVRLMPMDTRRLWLVFFLFLVDLVLIKAGSGILTSSLLQILFYESRLFSILRSLLTLELMVVGVDSLLPGNVLWRTSDDCLFWGSDLESSGC